MIPKRSGIKSIPNNLNSNKKGIDHKILLKLKLPHPLNLCHFSSLSQTSPVVRFYENALSDKLIQTIFNLFETEFKRIFTLILHTFVTKIQKRVILFLSDLR